MSAKSQTPAEIANNSGIRFNCEVATHLRDSGWTVQLSPYYVDRATDKSRELDMLAEKSFMVLNDHPLRPPTHIHVRLYIECKYIDRQVVFWFDDRDQERTVEWLDKQTMFRSNNTYSKTHRYLHPKRQNAKLFASEHVRGDQVEPIFNTVTQVLSGYFHTKGRAALARNKTEAGKNVFLHYPVVICSTFDKYTQTTVRNREAPTPIADPFLLEVDYEYIVNNQGGIVRQFCLIDFVPFNKLSEFEVILESEVEAAKMLID